MEILNTFARTRFKFLNVMCRLHTMVPIIIAVVMRAAVDAQNCFGGIETFEKTSMADFDNHFSPAGTLLQQPNQALTRDCVNLCKQQPQCFSFALDYTRFRCAAYNVNSIGRRDHILLTNTTNLFEKVCYKGVPRDEYQKVCGLERLWAFERVKNAFLEGFEDSTISNVGSKDECAKACLMETSFVCRSADYDYSSRVCRLSKEDRRTQPQAFRQLSSSSRDYIENQCAAAGPTTCLYNTKRDVGVITMDSLEFALNLEDCQIKCDKESTFNCRSFSIADRRCFLSGDDTVSLSNTALPPKAGSVYGEKKCVTEHCVHGIFTYEKITGYVLRTAISTPIDTIETGKLGITGQCRDSCDRGLLACPAFTVNYQSSRCDKIDRNTQGRALDLIPRDGENYFEKICLRVPEIMSMCQDKYWAFERVLGYELTPVMYERVYTFVQSRRDCEEYCLQEKLFVCRSALYNDENTECKLSREDRRTKPANYVRNNNPKISYLENQCIPSHSKCPLVEFENGYPTYTDIVETTGVTSKYSCEKYCNDNRKFLCRSFSYYSSNGQCFISGDDHVSGGQSALQARSGMTYYERKCEKLPDSTTTDGGMTATDDGVTPTDTTGKDTSKSETGGSTGGVSSSTASTVDNTIASTNDVEHSTSKQFPSSSSGLILTSEAPTTTTYPSSISSLPSSTKEPTTSTTTVPSSHYPSSSNNLPTTIHKDPTTVQKHDPTTGSEYSSSSFFPSSQTTRLTSLNSDYPTSRAGISTTTNFGFPETHTTLGHTNTDHTLEQSSQTTLGKTTAGQTTLGQTTESNITLSQSTPGQTTFGHSTIGRTTFDYSTAGQTTADQTTLDQTTLGQTTLKKSTPGQPTLGRTTLDYTTISQTTLGQTPFGQTTLDQNTGGYTKQSTPGQTTLGHSTIGRTTLGYSTGGKTTGGQTTLGFATTGHATASHSTTNTGHLTAGQSTIDHVLTDHTLGQTTAGRTSADYTSSGHTNGVHTSTGRSKNGYTTPGQSTLSLTTSAVQPMSDHTRTSEGTTTTSAQTTSRADKGSVKCGANSRFIFERIPGFEPIGGYLMLLYSDTGSPGIVTECARRCEVHTGCRAFVVDYHRRSCNGLFERSSVGLLDLRLSRGKDYFEGFCAESHLVCNKLWIYDRVLDQESFGLQPKSIIRFVHRTDCRTRCLEEKRFQCLSASYDATRRECRLYDQDRYTGSLYLKFTKGTDYMENQCASETDSCHYLPIERDITITSVTKSVRGSSTFFCEQECNREKEFNCRSYTYIDHTTIPGANICLLSSDNRAGSQKGSIQYRPRALYAEKSCRGNRKGRGSTTINPVPVPTLTQYPSTYSSHTSPQTPILPEKRNCNYNEFTFEKTFGYDLRFAKRERSRIPPQIGIVAQCQDECLRRGHKCQSFVIDYGTDHNCFLLDGAANDQRKTLSKSINVAYFEKICLKGAPTCGKVWTFERVIGYTFEEIPEKAAANVETRVDCEELCLRTSCRSMTYDYTNKICRTFTESRRSKPLSFKPTLKEIDYIENECVKELKTCQYRNYPETFTPFVDRVSHAFSLSDCQRLCNEENTFICRTVNYELQSRECALCSEDRITASIGQSPLQQRRNSIYSERAACEQVSVQCTQQEMLVTLHFDTPFIGRVYVKGNPAQCFVLGKGENHLQFPISLGFKCGTRQEGPRNFANEIIIQQHPVIMTDSDRSIKVMCSFEAVDQTVTLSSASKNKPGIDVTSVTNARTSLELAISNVVTNTAPPPAVLMRILDRTGHDAQIVGLGDELTLKIELRDPATAFAIFARNLYARSSNGESLLLIDNTGCPKDPAVFPQLKLDSRDKKSLSSTFKAFRFPSTGVVNFEVQIRFCQDSCEPVKCLDGLQSYGRKKRNVILPQVNSTSIESIDFASPSTNISPQEFMVRKNRSAVRSRDEVSIKSNLNQPLMEQPIAMPLMNPNHTVVQQPQYFTTNNRQNYNNNYQTGHSYNQWNNANQMSQYNRNFNDGSYNYPLNSYYHHNSVPSNVNNAPEMHAGNYPIPTQHINPLYNDWRINYGQNANNSRSQQSHNPKPVDVSAQYMPIPQQSYMYYNYAQRQQQPPAYPTATQPHQQHAYQPQVHQQHTVVSESMAPVSVPKRVKTKNDAKPFRPPRPLPRPKGVPVRPNVVSSNDKSGTPEVPLSLAIVVGDKDKNVKEKKDRNVERKPVQKQILVPENNCSTGPAILLTALIVTLAHCFIILGAYFYYKRYMRYSGLKLFESHASSTENITTVSQIPNHRNRNNSNVFFGPQICEQQSNTVGFRSLYSGSYGSPP